MAMLTRIKDPLRLKEGDIVILPADYSGRRRLRTHLSLNTLGKVGLSIGRTCRSTNNEKIVKTWLVDEPEETRYFIVTNVCHLEMDTTRQKYAPLMTNDGWNKELIPKVCGISITKIAAPGEDATLADAARFCYADGRDRVFSAMSRSFFSGYLVFSRYREGGDTMLDELFDQPDVKSPTGPIPCSDQVFEGVLTTQKVSQSFRDILDEEYVPEITMPAKAISALAKRGYVFARPDSAFTDTMARSCVKALLTEAVKGWEERGKIFRDYMKNVHLMAEAIITRFNAYNLGAKRTWVKANERRRAAALAGKVIE